VVEKPFSLSVFNADFAACALGYGFDKLRAVKLYMFRDVVNPAEFPKGLEADSLHPGKPWKSITASSKSGIEIPAGVIVRPIYPSSNVPYHLSWPAADARSWVGQRRADASLQPRRMGCLSLRQSATGARRLTPICELPTTLDALMPRLWFQDCCSPAERNLGSPTTTLAEGNGMEDWSDASLVNFLF
jgi:hypothetical protein